MKALSDLLILVGVVLHRDLSQNWINIEQNTQLVAKETTGDYCALVRVHILPLYDVKFTAVPSVG